MNILFHINESSKWKGVLENISNALEKCNESKEPFKIEAVANGEAVLALKKQAAVNLNIISKSENYMKKE